MHVHSPIFQDQLIEKKIKPIRQSKFIFQRLFKNIVFRSVASVTKKLRTILDLFYMDYTFYRPEFSNQHIWGRSVKGFMTRVSCLKLIQLIDEADQCQKVFVSARHLPYRTHLIFGPQTILNEKRENVRKLHY